MLVKAIVFDVDGVLINSDDSYPRVVQKALRDFAGVRASKKEILKKMGYAGIEWFKPFVRGRSGNRALAQKMFEWGEAVYWHDYLPKYAKPVVGARKTLIELKKKGFKLAIVTNQSRLEALASQRLIGFRDFDVVVNADDAPPKPNSKGLKIALKKLRVTPCEALFVGDTVVDKRLCRAVGVPLVLISWKRNEGARELRGVPRLKRFSELTKFV
jgi:phosphoglycolate phosphatase